MPQITLLLELCKGHTWPNVDVVDCTNITTVKHETYRREILVTCCPSQNEVQLVRRFKTGQDTVVVDGEIIRDQTVTLKKIWVDDILLDIALVLELAVYRNQFDQDYLDHCDQHQIAVAPIESHWPVWYFNGTWQWQFQSPFWSWYAERRYEKQQKYLSKEHIELYLGTGVQSHETVMQELKNLLDDAV